MFEENDGDYFEGFSEFKNPLSAEFFQTRQEIFKDQMEYMEQNPGMEEETGMNEEYNIRFEEALEGFLQNFVKNGLTIRGES